MPDNSNSPALLARWRAESRGSWMHWLHLSVILLSCLCLTGSTGCTRSIFGRQRDPGLGKAVPPLSAEATAEEILARVNENAYSEYSPTGLHSFRSDDITVRMSGVPASMRASMVVEAPRNLRLRVAHPVTGGEAVDIGSNDEKFWVWMKESPQHNVMVCSHDHISMAAQVTSLPLPFRPDWLMEVLGVAPISGTGYEIHRNKANSPILELVSVQRSPDQHPVKRIVKVNTVYGVVTEHRVESLEGKMIAKATLFRHFRDPKTKLIMPRQINIDWPIDGQPIALSLEFNSIDFNSPSESVAMWTPPDMPGYPELDIGLIAMQRLGKPADAMIRQTKDSTAGKATLDDEPDEGNQDASPFYGDNEESLAQPSDQSLDRIERPIQSAEVDSPFESDAKPEQSLTTEPAESMPFDNSAAEQPESESARPFPAE